MWTKFCKGTTKKNSAEYWKKIKQISHLETKEQISKKPKIPSLNNNGEVANSEYEKAQLFGSLWQKYFQMKLYPALMKTTSYMLKII